MARQQPFGAGDFHLDAQGRIVGRGASPGGWRPSSIRVHIEPQADRRYPQAVSTNLFWQRAIDAGRAWGHGAPGALFDVGSPGAIGAAEHLLADGERRLGRYTIPPLGRSPIPCDVADPRFGRDRMGCARGGAGAHHRAGRAITDAFVRASEGGLLLPRIVAIGDPDLDEAVGPLFDPADADPVPPAVPPLKRRMILARLLTEARGDSIEPAEAVRLAGELGRTLDQMQSRRSRHRRARSRLTAELSDHWQAHYRPRGGARSLGRVARLGVIDMVERRRMLPIVPPCLARATARGVVCVAGVTIHRRRSAAATRRAGLRGAGGAAGLATDRDEAQWASLGPPTRSGTGAGCDRSRPPPYHLKLLLDRMGVNRAEVAAGGGERAGCTQGGGKAIASAMAPGRSPSVDDVARGQRRFDGVRALEVATPAEEAQAIALALREVLDCRGGPRRGDPRSQSGAAVAAHCARWAWAVDDSRAEIVDAAAGTLLLAIADAIASASRRWRADVAQHPGRGGEGGWHASKARARSIWRCGGRGRGRGSGDRRALREGDKRTARVREAAAAWWGEARARLKGLLR